MTAKLEHGRLECDAPQFQGGEFLQSFTFRAPVVIGGERAMEQIMQSVMAQFAMALAASGIEQHQWPPTRVEVTPHADWMGFHCLLGTLAREPGMVVIQTRH